MPRRWFSALLVLVFGCGTTERSEQAPSPADPADAFGALEDRLLNADSVRFDFHVTAEGAVEADIRGALAIGPADQVHLTAAGHFGGQPVDLLLRSAGDTLEFGNQANRTTTSRPAHLQEALLIGLTRMGILHNLARLTGGREPDHADGGVREWVTVGTFAAGSSDSDAISFYLTVAGEPSGSASLEIDSRGRPIVRRQAVQFPSGEMRVTERYSAVTIEP